MKRIKLAACCNPFQLFYKLCAGSVAERLGMNQLIVYEKLKRSNILDGYIIPAYDVLHTYGGEYITDELVDSLREKGELL